MIHLHWFSHYSMQQGLANPKEIISKAKELNQPAIAITDYLSWYGLLEFYEKAEDVKPILWAHMLVSYDWKNFMWLVLLAKNYDWYKNLIKLISIANTKNFKSVPFLTLENLREYGKNLIWLSSWEGEIEKLIINNEPDNLILDKISEYEEIFSGEFYLEFLTLDYQLFPERKKIEENFIKFIENNGKKWVVTSFYKYLNKEDKETYDILLCIKNNWKYYDSSRPRIKWDYYIMDENEVKQILSKNWLPEKFQTYLIKQTHNIADKINIEIPLHQLLFPKYEVPEKYKKLYEKLQNISS